MNVNPASHKNAALSATEESRFGDTQAKPKSRLGWRWCFVQLLTLTAVGGALVALAVLFGFDNVFGSDSESEDASVVVIKETATPCANQPAELPSGCITDGISHEMIESAKHPLIPLLEVARAGIIAIERGVQDYSATIIKRERVNGKLQNEQQVFCKIRHARVSPDGCTPFSAYTRFLRPKSIEGQEAIWVEGCNEGKLIAHTTGLLNVIPFRLEPDGPVAMRGNRHTIREIGMLNLINQMIEKGERDRNYDECEVRFQRDVMVGATRCTRFEIIHPYPRDYFDFHIAKIYIDDERNLPIAYEGFLWPDEPGGAPVLLERYYYTNIQLNIGLTDEDFDPANPRYDFPREP